MTDDEGQRDLRGRAVPSGRLARFGGFGRLAGGVAAGVVAEGARRLAGGERPRLSDLVLTPANAARLADRLSHLRGAAMKLGQMISMDAGDLLPAELTAMLARLRSQAHRMPPAQLDRVLRSELGADWRRRFRSFEASPVAAASIGQVHRAILPDGRAVAVKVQYPGVRESIAADVDNVATLLRLSGLLPPALDLAPLLAEAKSQLADEADYDREAREMTRYGALLAGDARYIVPAPVAEVTTGRMLTMDWLDGRPIETLADESQSARDDAMSALIELVLRELFEFGAMQTDPNFANYRWQPETGRIVLLDFGATRDVPPSSAAAYRALIEAGLSRDLGEVRDAAVTAGFLNPVIVARHRGSVDRMIAAIDGAMSREGPFDFGARDFAPIVRDEAVSLLADRSAWHVPPPDILFAQRKVSGTALLAARLRARVAVREMAARAIGRDEHVAAPAARALEW